MVGRIVTQKAVGGVGIRLLRQPASKVVGKSIVTRRRIRQAGQAVERVVGVVDRAGGSGQLRPTAGKVIAVAQHSVGLLDRRRPIHRVVRRVHHAVAIGHPQRISRRIVTPCD